jgi:predicted amidohydrolase
MKISCIQFAPVYGEVEGNLDRMCLFATQAEGDIVIFPELCLTGYFFKSKSEIAPLAESIQGPTVAALSALAREEGKAIVTGFLEESEGSFYNSSLAFDANGQLVGHYRKVHLFYYETQIFATGDLGFPVFPIKTRSGSVDVGMLICYDWRFPEAARILALNGAALIAIPSNIVTTTAMLHVTLRTRAFENKVGLAFADRTGSETNSGETLQFRGESAIIGMNGEVLTSASEHDEEIISTEIDLSKAQDKQINAFNDIITDRPRAGYGI